MPVMFWSSTAEQACTAFQRVGAVFESTKGALLPWIARITDSTNRHFNHAETSRTSYVKPGQTIQVKSLLGSEDHKSPGLSCGPLFTAFTPERAHSYLVEFVVKDWQTCNQRVTDVTDPDHPSAVGEGVTCGGQAQRLAMYTDNKNWLKSFHEQVLDESRKSEVTAASDADKAAAMKSEASALDSLGRSDEALAVIDQALKLADPSKNSDLIATKATILFALNQPQAALALLTPQLEGVRSLANGKPAFERTVALSRYTEGFVTATFSNIQLEHWQAAISTLADAESPLEGARFYAYRALVYRYIMSRAKDPSLANAHLEHDATYYAEHDKSHYGALLRMWQGTDTVPQAIHELNDVMSGMNGTDRQEAEGEALFYRAAYLKFAAGNPTAAQFALQDLNDLAPFGSIEWVYGRRVLN